jgi:hypothetical protein
MTAAVTVDAAGAQMGGAARYLNELRGYLTRTGREDVEIIGSLRRVEPGWLLRRELSSRARNRRVALNNVGFVTPGGQRWTLLRNALHFLTEGELAQLDPVMRATVRRQSVVVHLTARRSDVIVAPSTAMTERIATVRPDLSSRVVVRPHPVSAASIPRLAGDPIILCPVLFARYKQMAQRLIELLAAIADLEDRPARRKCPRLLPAIRRWSWWVACSTASCARCRCAAALSIFRRTLSHLAIHSRRRESAGSLSSLATPPRTGKLLVLLCAGTRQVTRTRCDEPSVSR